MIKPELAIALSGAIGSGKSSLSRAIAEDLGCVCVGFGTQVREEARIRGLDDSRETLQSLGESLVREQIESFCKSVLAQASPRSHSPLLIDGLRHVEVLDLLHMLVAPRRLVLVYIEVAQAARSARLAQDVSTWDTHSTEVQVPIALRDRADLILDGNQDPATLCSNVVSWIKRLQS